VDGAFQDQAFFSTHDSLRRYFQYFAGGPPTFVDGEKLFTPTRPGHAMVDLLKANRDQLISTGVNPGRIHTAPICTMCRTDLFFSYRKEKSVHGKVGRLMAVVGRK
jgi:hypothetical protein